MTREPAHWCVRHHRTLAYDITECSSLFSPENTALLLPGRLEGGRRFVVLDRQVARHHGEEISSYFAHRGIDAKIVLFTAGEAGKTFDRYLDLLRELDAFPIHRRDEPIIAIGGGVLTDVVGYVASSYRRGVPHVKVPTTLMGYVDAAVGIKNGINFNGHKNRLGSFEPPLRVLLDRGFLNTLPHSHILNGVCEIIKLAIIKDAHLFHLLEIHGSESIDARFQNDTGEAILRRAISGILEELEPDLFESNLMRTMDFGHTFCYGLEARHEDHLLHGEAVLLDIVVSVLIAQRRHLISVSETDRIFRLIDTLGIALDGALLDPELMWRSLLDRVEHRNGHQSVPMPNPLGRCVFLNDISRREIERSVEELEKWRNPGYEPACECRS